MSDKSKKPSTKSGSNKNKPQQSNNNNNNNSTDNKMVDDNNSNTTNSNNDSNMDNIGENINIPITGSYLTLNYDYSIESKKVPGFICGSCHALNQLRARESIRCRECGYRIMYKERLRKPMIYSAQ